MTLYDNGGFVLSSLDSSHVTLGWKTRANCILACDDAVKNFPGKRMNCFWDLNIIKEYVTDPIPTYVDFQVNNCTIPVGKSSCATSVFV